MAFRKLAAASARDVLGDRRRAAPASLSEWFAIGRPTHWNEMLRDWNRRHFGETALDDEDLWERLDEIREALPRAQRALASVFREHLDHTLVFYAERAYQLGIAVGRLTSPGTRGPNLLLCGDHAATAIAIRVLSAAVPIPVVTWTATSEVSLPELDHGTIVLQDVDRLSPSTQLELLKWLDDHTGPVQIIATVTSDLFALVSSGVFMDRLYYLLNTCVLDLAAPSEPGGAL
jgi:hypothetical protein